MLPSTNAAGQVSFRDDPDEDLIALISRVAGGDKAALASLYQATSSRLFGLALRILGDPTAAEEVLLDVYTQIWRTATSYRQERGQPMTWMVLMTRSRAIDVLRSSAARAMAHAQAIDSLRSWPDSGPGPEENSEMAKRRRVIGAALANLKPDQREPIELAFFSGLSHNEIAAQLKRPLGTVKTLIRSGLMRLRDLVEREGVSL